MRAISPNERKQLTFGSLFSGVGGFDRALEDAGMQCHWQAEIDRQCRSVLRRHWPDTTLLEDVKDVDARNAIRRPDLVCAGWPCQGNSVAGRRAGMADERSGLWGEVKRVLRVFAPTWFLGENVPGILSVNGGRDWAAVLADLAELGYGFAYRVLDSQWFGVPQRRRRVFIVGCLGDWRRAAEVLFERESLPWDSPPSRTTGQRVAASLTRGADSGGRGGYAGRRREDDVNLAYCLNAKGGSGRIDGESETFLPVGTLQASDGGPSDCTPMVAHTLRAEGFDASEDGTGRGTPIIPIDMRQASRGGTFTNNRPGGSSGGAPGTGIGEPGDPSFTVCDSHTPAVLCFDERNITSKANRTRVEAGRECHTLHESPPAVAFAIQERACSESDTSGPGGKGYQEGVGFTLESRHHAQSVASQCSGVRRLTPLECERLQGWPDNWTRWDADGNELADSPRYRMCGNGVSMPPVNWIGRRIVAATEQPHA